MGLAKPLILSVRREQRLVSGAPDDSSCSVMSAVGFENFTLEPRYLLQCFLSTLLSIVVRSGPCGCEAEETERLDESPQSAIHGGPHSYGISRSCLLCLTEVFYAYGVDCPLHQNAVSPVLHRMRGRPLFCIHRLVKPCP